MDRVTMSAVWDRTSEFVRDHLAALTAIAGLGLFVPFVLTGLWQALNQADPSRPGYVSAWLLLGVMTVIGRVAVISFSLHPMPIGRHPWVQAFRRGPIMVGWLAIAFIALIALTVPVALILIGKGVRAEALSSGAWPSLPAGTNAGLILYGLAAVGFFLWIAARLLPLWAVVTFERRGLGAFSRAFALTRGLAVRIFGVLLLYLIVSGVATLAAKGVVGSVLRIAFGAGEGLTVASIGTALAVSLVATVFSVLASVFTANLYLATTERAPAA